jgi:ABC-type transport system involved in multi-copper enzyme maturation permease subunit
MYFLPLPESLSAAGFGRVMLLQELRSLLLSPALWAMYIIISLLVGYSFIQAVDLFSQASKTALSYPELATGMNTLDGIFVPTFGAYYLTQTLLLPFIAIRLIGLDKHNGTLKLLLQLPVSSFSLCLIKITAMGFVWAASLLPAVLSIVVWHKLDGHIFLPELTLLLAGHGLYSLTVITIAMFTAAVSDSLPTAAMLCLAITLGSWVLEFTAAGQTGFVGLLGKLSLTGMLRQFENGLFSLSTVVLFAVVSTMFFLLTVIWLHPGKLLSARLTRSMLCIALLSLVAWGGTALHGYVDMTENQRHSLNPADVRALRSLHSLLTLTVHLTPQDGRLLDLEHDLLAKLRRIVPQLTVHYVQTTAAGLFDTGSDEEYGLIEIAYNHKKENTYSNSQQEILPIIFQLAGLKVHPDQVTEFKGYPLVVDASGYNWWFYFVLPLFFALTGIYVRKMRW